MQSNPNPPAGVATPGDPAADIARALHNKMQEEYACLNRLSDIQERIQELCVDYSRAVGTINLTRDQVLRDIAFKHQRRAA